MSTFVLRTVSDTVLVLSSEVFFNVISSLTRASLPTTASSACSSASITRSETRHRSHQLGDRPISARPDGFVPQIDLLADGLFDHIAANPHATVIDVTLADAQLLFIDFHFDRA